jgi:hypothetical protein
VSKVVCYVLKIDETVVERTAYSLDCGGGTSIQAGLLDGGGIPDRG